MSFKKNQEGIVKLNESESVRNLRDLISRVRAREPQIIIINLKFGIISQILFVLNINKTYGSWKFELHSNQTKSKYVR